MRIGVSGIGSIGARHARLLAARPDMDVIVYDAGGPVMPAELIGRVRVADSFGDLLERAPDGLVVAVPDPWHVEQSVAALLAGVPVLVEKPVAQSVAAGRELAEVAAATGIPVLVGYVLRHTCSLGRAADLLAAGAIGTPVSVHATLGAYETLRVARNRFTEPARFRLPYDYSHEWDYLRWLFGPIRSVVATGRQVGDLPLTQDPNVIDALLTFEDGLTGTVHLDYVQLGGRRFEVVGDRGTLRADLPRGLVTVQPQHTGTADAGVSRRYEQIEQRDAAFDRQLDHFIEVIRGEREPLVSLADGIAAIEVADAVVRACESGLRQSVHSTG